MQRGHSFIDHMVEYSAMLYLWDTDCYDCETLFLRLWSAVEQQNLQEPVADLEGGRGGARPLLLACT